MVAEDCPDCRYRFDCKITCFKVANISKEEKCARIYMDEITFEQSVLISDLACAYEHNDQIVLIKPYYYDRVKAILFKEPEIDKSWLS